MSATNDAIHSTEQGIPLPEPTTALRRATDVANALQPWLNQMMRFRWGHRVATPHYHLDDVRVQELSGSRWRVSSKSFAADDRRGLLGFIEKLDDHFEAMELGAGQDDFAWFTFPSLTTAEAHFSGSHSWDSEQQES